MGEIKIFFASSIEEFKNERDEIGNYIQTLNNIFYDKGIYIRPIMCEGLSNAVAKRVKQDEYDEQIHDSDYFYVILGKEVGEFTLHEFDVAFDSFKVNDFPKIYTYFRKNISSESEADSIIRFRERLENEILHYYSFFSDVAQIKLNIILEILRDIDSLDILQISNGTAKIYDTDLINMNHVPSYSGKSEIKELSSKTRELEGEYSRLITLFKDNPDDQELLKKVLEVGGEKERLLSDLHKYENDLLDIYFSIVVAEDSENEFLHRAARLLDEGKPDEALEVLNDSRIKEHYNQAQHHLELAFSEIEDYIIAQNMKFAALKSKSFEGKDAAIACCAELFDLIRKHKIKTELLIACRNFLVSVYNYELAKDIGEWLDKFYALESVDLEKQLENKNSLGVIYSLIGEHSKAINIYENILASIPKENLIGENAALFNNIANAYAGMDNGVEAIKIFKEGIAALEEVNDPDEETLFYLALTHQSFANVLIKNNIIDKPWIDKETEAAQSILEELALNNDDIKIKGLLAEIYISRAQIASQPKEQRKYINRAIENARLLSQIAPLEYTIGLAEKLLLAAYMKMDMNMYTGAIEYSIESSRIWELFDGDSSTAEIIANVRTNLSKCYEIQIVCYSKLSDVNNAQLAFENEIDNIEKAFKENTNTDTMNNLIEELMNVFTLCTYNLRDKSPGGDMKIWKRVIDCFDRPYEAEPYLIKTKIYLEEMGIGREIVKEIDNYLENR